jgi:hypothetical protein
VTRVNMLTAGLEGWTLIPLVDGGRLVRVLVEFRDAPGVNVSFTAAAVAELASGLRTLLDTKDWAAYGNKYGWNGPQPVEIEPEDDGTEGIPDPGSF